MKIKFVLAFALCFFVAAAIVQAATLATDVTTFTIKPDQNFTVGDTGYLSLHVVSNAGVINFTASVSAISGSTTLSDFTVANRTGSCTLFTCTYDGLWGFTITSIPVTFQAVITNPDTGVSTTKNATTGIDADNDSYYSIPSGGNDCNDNNAAINPSATEACNSVDDNCDGQTDEGCGGSTPSDGGGHRSDGGGGGKTSGALSVLSYDCTKGNVSLGKNDKIIFEYRKTNYTFYVQDVLAGSVQLKLYPIPSRDYAIDEGKSREIDLDRNNRNDFTITLKDIEMSKAVISCKITTEIGGVVEQEEEGIIEPVLQNIKEGVIKIASQIVPKKQASPAVGSLIALAIVVGGLAVYYILRKGKDEEEF